MPIYTKKGDKGTTKLLGDKRKRSKADCRVRALGEVDELNSLVGVVVSFLPRGKVKSNLLRVQSDLFRIQMDIASKGHVFAEGKIARIGKEHVVWLEKHIDEMSAKVPPLTQFILPGGSKAAALCQLARAVCRRAERELVAAKAERFIHKDVLQYINRLSDFFFASARFINATQGISEPNPDYYND